MESPLPYSDPRIPPREESVPPPKPPARPLLHLGLLLATVVTTVIAGSLYHAETGDLSWTEILSEPTHWIKGIPYSFSVLSILMAHELGHYFACRRYGIPATLPFFLPGIPILGTFGAFIRIRGRIPDRRSLFDIGAAGPIAGFVVALPIFLYGMSQSELVSMVDAQGDFMLGFPLLFQIFVPIFFPVIPDGTVLSLSPYLSAAWVGMLATSLNLLPAGQLDGGHICYALSRRFHARVSKMTLVGVILLGMLHRAWLLWAVILLFIGDRHPPLLFDEKPLPPARKGWALVALIIFFLSFIPFPIDVSP